jgi:hypothetical protein
MIFSDFSRSDTTPRKYSERRFTHLDRSAEPEFVRVRELLESWSAHLPADSLFQVEQRFQSCDDREFDSAFLELYVHELLLRTGHAIVHHPELPHTKKRPDFLATDHNSYASIIEATVTTEATDENRGSEARLNALKDAINERVASPDYFVSMDIDGRPNTPIPVASWSEQIQAWLAGLNYESIVALSDRGRFDCLPSLELGHDGALVTVRPLAKRQSARGKPGRTLGVEGAEGCWVTSHIDIEKVLRKKATRYGQLTLPFIVAVNCIGQWSVWEEIHEAIYGDEGLWPSPDQVSLRRLSAVLAIDHLLPWSIPRTDAMLFHNPNAAIPYCGAFTGLPQAKWEAGQVRVTGGTHPRALLGLSESWPD